MRFSRKPAVRAGSMRSPSSLLALVSLGMIAALALAPVAAAKSAAPAKKKRAHAGADQLDDAANPFDADATTQAEAARPGDERSAPVLKDFVGDDPFAGGARNDAAAAPDPAASVDADMDAALDRGASDLDSALQGAELGTPPAKGGRGKGFGMQGVADAGEAKKVRSVQKAQRLRSEAVAAKARRAKEAELAHKRAAKAKALEAAARRSKAYEADGSALTQTASQDAGAMPYRDLLFHHSMR